MMDCKHEQLDVCGCGVGLAECLSCGRHVDLLELGRGSVFYDDDGVPRTLIGPPSMPLDQPKCSMMLARLG